MSSANGSSPDATLVSIPISPFAARSRLLIYSKGIEGNVAIAPPEVLGGFKSEKHLSVNKLGKVPVLLLSNGDTLTESAVITEYIAEMYANVEPSFVPADAVQRARNRLIASLLDQYVVPFQSAMYKGSGTIEERATRIDIMRTGFDCIEQALDDSGPYVAGKHIGVGDASLWGCLPFYEFMLPTFFGWNVCDDRPKLARWIDHFRKEPQAARVYDEVWDALVLWWEGGRWEKLGMKALVDPTTIKPSSEAPVSSST